MKNKSITSDLIFSGQMGQFELKDYLDLPPKLWGTLPKHKENLRSFLENNPHYPGNKNRPKEVYNHVRIAIDSKAYTFLKGHSSQAVFTQLEKQLEELHGDDFGACKPNNLKPRYRIEEDVNLSEGWVKFRFGSAVYVRNKNEKENAKWNIQFSTTNKESHESWVIPVHKGETTVLIGKDFYSNSYSFQDWPLSPDIQLLITHSSMGSRSEVGLEVVYTKPDPQQDRDVPMESPKYDCHVEATQQGWEVTDHKGNKLILSYNKPDNCVAPNQSHTQAFIRARNNVVFEDPSITENQPEFDHDPSHHANEHHVGDLLDTEFHTHVYSDASQHGIYPQEKSADYCVEDPEIIPATNTIKSDDEDNANNNSVIEIIHTNDTNGDSQSQKHISSEYAELTGLLLKGIALMKPSAYSAAPLVKEISLPLQPILSLFKQAPSANSSLVMTDQELLLVHEDRTYSLDQNNATLLPLANLVYHPASGDLSDKYLGWIALPSPVMISTLEFDQTLCKTDALETDQTTALPAVIEPPVQGMPTPTASFHKQGQLINLCTGKEGISYYIPHSDTGEMKSSESIPLRPQSNIMQDDQDAFTLVCGQHVLEYLPAKAN